MANSQLGRKHPQEVIDKLRKANQGENNPAYGMGEKQGESHGFKSRTQYINGPIV